MGTHDAFCRTVYYKAQYVLTNVKSVDMSAFSCNVGLFIVSLVRF